jgi:hypothetical protein
MPVYEYSTCFISDVCHRIYIPAEWHVYTPGWMAVQCTPLAAWLYPWLDGCIHPWLNGCIHPWLDACIHPWLDACIHPCWMAVYIPSWMAVYTPGWIAVYTPGWMPVVLDSTGRTNEFAPILQYLGQKTRDHETSLAAGGRGFMFGTTGGGLIVR